MRLRAQASSQNQDSPGERSSTCGEMREMGDVKS